MDYTVYYWKDTRLMADVFLHNKTLTPKSLESTHTKLGTFSAKNKEDLFRNMQAETLCPEDAIKIKTRKPSHTSMSVGDVVQEGENFFLADICGYTHIS